LARICALRTGKEPAPANDDLKAAVAAYKALTFRGGLDPIAEPSDEDGPGETSSLVEQHRYKLHRRIERNPTTALLRVTPLAQGPGFLNKKFLSSASTSDALFAPVRGRPSDLSPAELQQGLEIRRLATAHYES
jgi:hypothetical protein